MLLGSPVTSLSLGPCQDLLATAHVGRRGIYLWSNQVRCPALGLELAGTARTARHSRPGQAAAGRGAGGIPPWPPWPWCPVVPPAVIATKACPGLCF
jgi:hypothetical protein